MLERTDAITNVGCGRAWNGLPQIHILQYMLERTDAITNVGCGPAWNGLPLNTYISVFARTKQCYNERRLWANLERITAKYIYYIVC